MEVVYDVCDCECGGYGYVFVVFAGDQGEEFGRGEFFFGRVGDWLTYFDFVDGCYLWSCEP